MGRLSVVPTVLIVKMTVLASDRITLIAPGPYYLRGPYISCGSKPFQTLISSNPPLLTRVENCV